MVGGVGWGLGKGMWDNNHRETFGFFSVTSNILVQACFQ